MKNPRHRRGFLQEKFVGIACVDGNNLRIGLNERCDRKGKGFP